MINVIVPITNNGEKYIESLSQLSLRSDVNLVVGITESLHKTINLDFPNVKLKVFDDKSKKEEILNSLQYLLEEGKTLICRRPFSMKEYKEFTQTNASIVFGKEKKENKIKTLFHMFGQEFMQLVLGVKPFGGDFSLICFDEDMTSVLRQAENFSYSTRVDRWKGVTKQAIEVENYAIGDKYNQSDAGIVAVLEDGTKKDITENLIFVGEDNLKLDDDGNFTEAGEYKVKVYALEEREDMYIGEWTIKVS